MRRAHLGLPAFLSFVALIFDNAVQAQPNPARTGAVASHSYQPDPASVQRFGPAYRFPQAGWTVLHIEGEPYERGYQHGKLMSSEIAAHLKCFA
jgi:hypothetical protein